MTEPITYHVIFLGGPCDGLTQEARKPPPEPEYLQPRGGTIDAVYCLSSVVGTTYRYKFQGYRDRSKEQ